MIFLFVSLMTIFFSNPLWADSEAVAKAIIVKGIVHVVEQDGEISQLKTNDNVNAKVSIRTEDKSFAKLLFIDKSQMSIGPNSEVEVSNFEKNEAGLITIMRGQIRSKVSKDYMQIEDKNKSKLLLQTKTAAMGVRGTDFLATYNPQNEATTLITFEGAVAMVRKEGSAWEGEDLSKKLDKLLNSPQAVIVKKGEYSGTNKNAKRVTFPVKIDPRQFEDLKNKELGEEGKKSENKSSNFRSPVPSGIDSKIFNAEQVNENINTDNKLTTTTLNSPPPEGGFASNGTYAPPAGGPVDLETGIYVAPDPTKGRFDATTGTYTLDPMTQGRVVDGAYVPPVINGVAYKLNFDGQYIVDEEKTQQLEQTEGRSPASDQVIPPPTEGLNAPKLITYPGFVTNYETIGTQSTVPQIYQEYFNQVNEMILQDLCTQYPNSAACKPPETLIPKNKTPVKFILKTK